MKILKNKLKNELNIRTEKDYPIKGIEFIDIMPLVIQKESFKEIIDIFVSELKDKQIDYIIAPEARGFLFGTAVAYKIGCGILPVRKKGKLPPTTVEAEFESEKEYGKDILVLPKLVKDNYSGKRFYILDDIYATGNTVKSIKNIIEKRKGILVGTGVVLNILELNNDKDVFSIIDVNEE